MGRRAAHVRRLPRAWLDRGAAVNDIEQQIVRIVAEWVVNGFVPEADATKVIRLLHGGYVAAQLMGKQITVTACCEQYLESLRKIEAMSPHEYAAIKQRYLRAIKGRKL